MRIGINFYIHDPYISGVEYYTLGLINALVKYGDNHEYIIFTNSSEFVKEHVIAKENVSIIQVKYLKTRLLRIVWEHLRLPSLSKKYKLNLLHCPHYICPVFKKSRIPYVVTVHDTIAIDFPRLCKTSNALYYNLFMGLAVKNAAKAVVVSNNTAERFSVNFKRFKSKLNVIYSGIDEIFNSQHRGGKEEEIRKKYTLPDDYILYVGNLEPKKNIINLLRAFRYLKARGLKHSLVLTGLRSWKSDHVKRYIQANFTAGEILFTGYIDRNDLPVIYRMASLLISTSLCEGFGFPAVEAMACGTAVVSSRTGILEEVNEKCYERISTDNPSQIADSMYSVITDREKRQRQIRLGLEEAKRFSWQNCARKMLRVYEEVACV